MLRIPISSEDIVVIERERYYHPQPHIMILEVCQKEMLIQSLLR